MRGLQKEHSFDIFIISNISSFVNHKKENSHIYYEPLAEGVRHFKETEKGRDTMCESFERLADKVGDLRVEQTKIDIIKLMMKNMKCTLEEALNALEIKGKERAVIAKRLQKP
jgi:hypothetical protein